jgi:hypothetical protein
MSCQASIPPFRVRSGTRTFAHERRRWSSWVGAKRQLSRTIQRLSEAFRAILWYSCVRGPELGLGSDDREVPMIGLSHS